MPCSRLRYMFSIMTIASSTTKPTEIASAISDRLSIEKPASHIPAQVPASASGTETPAAIVGVVRRRNRNTTNITRNTVASSVNCISSTLARIVPVRSTSVEISTPDGIHDFGDVGQPHEIAALALDDDVAKLGGRAHLLVDGDCFALAADIEDDHRPKRIGRNDRLSYIVGCNPSVGQSDRI